MYLVVVNDEPIDDIFERRLLNNQRQIDRVIDEVATINRELGLIQAAIAAEERGPDVKTIGETHGHLYDWSEYKWGKRKTS